MPSHPGMASWTGLYTSEIPSQHTQEATHQQCLHGRLTVLSLANDQNDVLFLDDRLVAVARAVLDGDVSVGESLLTLYGDHCNVPERSANDGWVDDNRYTAVIHQNDIFVSEF